ncbi:MAG: L,D-transpeptidase family protein [Dehalococcoidia bacterium]
MRPCPPRRVARGAWLLASAAALLLTTSCSFGSSARPTPTSPPTATETPLIVPSATPLPTPTATPSIGAGGTIVVGGDLRTRGAPSTQGPVVSTLKDKQAVQIIATVQGENWVVGTQTWVSTSPDWARTWYELSDKTFVYAPFVFILGPNEVSPFVDPQGQEKWVDVNVTTQTASAMVGAKAIFSAPVSTGQAGFPTPLGTFKIEPDGRLPVERMTAAQAGFNPGQATYDVERVLFTQYFDRKGDALHLNYWRPSSVFGRTPTSHGCVGIEMHGAQYFWLFGSPGMRVEIHR